MTELFDESVVPLAAQIRCIEREIGFRERCYPRWVEQKKLTQKTMDDELRGMRAVLRTLKGIAESAT